MPQRHLRETLEKLHEELQRAGTDIDERSRELLRAIVNDINEIVEPTQDAAPLESLGQRLRESVDSFEESHPALTEAVGRVVDALAKMGI
jgi:hypothetical protein